MRVLPEWRWDPLSGVGVIVAPERRRRPGAAGLDDAAPCPFCPGHEEATPPESVAARPAGTPPNTPGWETRVVPNRYPAWVAADPAAADPPIDDEVLGGSSPATGVHEVVIDTPDHTADLHQLPVEAVARALRVCRDRLRDLLEAGGFTYGMLFKNAGRLAGASLAHSHWQLVALPEPPPAVAARLGRESSYHARRSRCLLCETVSRELAIGDRLLGRWPGVVAFLPFAGRLPYETRVVPVDHQSRFEDAPDATLRGAAEALPGVLGAIGGALDQPDYNIVVQTAPALGAAHHWWIEVFPRLTALAAFELAAGVCIHAQPAEEAAQILRRHLRPAPRQATR